MNKITTLLIIFIFFLCPLSYAGFSSQFVGKAKLLKTIKQSKVSKLDSSRILGEANFEVLFVKPLGTQESGVLNKGKQSGTVSYTKETKPQKNKTFFFRWDKICKKTSCNKSWSIISKQEFQKFIKR